jgi:hypothetical protein
VAGIAARTRRRILLATTVALFAIALGASAARAAVFSVDDDRVECPSAGFTTIQAAIDAASAGDTVAVCPGTYTEGNGAPGTSALTINKSLTLFGAGAGRVTIQPNAANGGSIADPGSDQVATAGTLLRNNTGNIVTVTAGPTTITGVRIRSGGVATEAGVAFHNATGVVRHSQITDLWNHSQFPRPTGVGVLGLADDGATHKLTVFRSVVQGYNIAGILLDATRSSTNSTLVGTINQDRIQGAGSQDDQQQDGVRLVDGASATITEADIDSNLYRVDRSRSAGIRLVAADATATHISDNNIQGNGYGLMSMDAADADVAPGPGVVDARSNWWGDPDGPCPQPVSPPPSQPVCPTTGDPITSASVDGSSPFTDPVISAQTFGDEPDADPTVKITTPADGAVLQPSVATPVKADAADDLAVQSVTFKKGATVLATTTTPPYQATYTPSAAEAGTSQVITATVRDAVGHSATDQVSVRIAAPVSLPPAPPEPDTAPTVKITSPLNRALLPTTAPTPIVATAADDHAVASVRFIILGKTLCVDTTVPYTCDFVPTASRVGRNSILAVATDSAQQQGQDLIDVSLGKFRPRALTLRVIPRGRRGTPHTRFTVKGRLRNPRGVSRALGCASGTVSVRFKVRRTTIRTIRIGVHRDCTYRRRMVRFRMGAALQPHTRVRAVARFLGNQVLTTKSSKRKFVVVG